MLSEAESQLAMGIEEGGYESPAPASIKPHVDFARELTHVRFVLIIPITLVVITEIGFVSVSLMLLFLVQDRQPRATYRPHIELEPKYNAALLIEKAKIGLSISKITELALKEYFSKNSK